MVESIYDELKNKYKEHPGLSHRGNVRDIDFNKNIKSEYIDEIQKNLQVLCNIHQNQSAVVFGAGPSLLDYKEIDDGSFIRVSCNRQIFREEILPFHLYINVDGGAGKKHSYASEFKEEIDYYQPLYAKFYGVHWKVLYDAYVDAEAIPFMIYTTKYRNHPYSDRAGRRNTTKVEDVNLVHTVKFSKDISVLPPALNSNVAFPIMQILLYMGFSKIFLFGFDASGGGRWNYPTAYWNVERYGESIVQWPKRWYFFRKWQKEEYPDVKIINVNPVALKGMMDEDIYT